MQSIPQNAYPTLFIKDKLPTLKICREFYMICIPNHLELRRGCARDAHSIVTIIMSLFLIVVHLSFTYAFTAYFDLLVVGGSILMNVSLVSLSFLSLLLFTVYTLYFFAPGTGFHERTIFPSVKSAVTAGL